MVSIIDLKFEYHDIQNRQSNPDLWVMVTTVKIKLSLKPIGDAIVEPPDLLEKGQTRTELDIPSEDYLSNRINKICHNNSCFP